MSSLVSITPKQKIVTTPWFQRNYSSNPANIEEELENAITQVVSSSEVTRVPSSSAVHNFVTSQMVLNSTTVNAMVQSYLNTLTHVFISSSLNTIFNISHSLDSNNIRYDLFLKNAENQFVFLDSGYQLIELNLNTVRIILSEPSNIKLISSRVL